MLYFLDISVDDRGVSLDSLFEVWEQEADAALAAKNAGLIRHIYKLVGERRVVVVVDAPDHDTLDDILTAKLPAAHHLRFNRVSPVREYEDFATALKSRFAD